MFQDSEVKRETKEYQVKENKRCSGLTICIMQTLERGLQQQGDLLGPVHGAPTHPRMTYWAWASAGVLAVHWRGCFCKMNKEVMLPTFLCK